MYRDAMIDALEILLIAERAPYAWEHLSRMDGFLKKHGESTFTRDLLQLISKECEHIEKDYERGKINATG